MEPAPNILPTRLRQLRQARGLSLEALATAMGGVVTKQALSKYQRGEDFPSLRVLSALAPALGVKVVDLCRAPSVAVEILAFRKTSQLGRREQAHVEGQVTRMLEERGRLQELTQQGDRGTIPIHSLLVSSLAGAESAADALRQRWELGTDPIASVVDALEDHQVHVLEIDAGERFDGLAAVARRADGSVAAAAVVCRRGLSHARQRLNLAHELGHLALAPAPDVDPEKAAFRFAGAFLAPARTLLREVGVRRSTIGLDELLLQKRRHGMSLQALLYRLRDLEVITETHARQWWQTINARGWKKQEPEELPPEEAHWLRQTVLRAFSEGLLTATELASLTGETVEEAPSLPLARRRAFLRLPSEERRRILESHATALKAHYDADSEWRTETGGDVLDG